MLVHLPIALILLLVILEWLARSPRFRHANATAGLILAIAVPTALASVLCGWLLSQAGGYEDRLLQLHKWTGIGTAGACLLAGLFYSLDLKKAYRWSLISSVLALVVASHYGGSLTHGSDYLVRYAPAPFRGWLTRKAEPQSMPATNSNPAEAQVFGALVQPIFKENCISCHGPEKSKASLRLDSFAGMLKGGESGPALVPGKADDSQLIKRVRLPMASDDHMPPEGKQQLSTSDIALLQWWIDSGAPTNATVAQLKPPQNITRILQARLGTPGPAPRELPAKPLADVLPIVQQLSDNLNVTLSAIAQKEPWLQCNASLAGTNFGDAAIEALKPLAANLRWLDLGGTAITDAGLERIAALQNLTRLHLERTAIDDSGLEHLSGLANLEYLNLYGTAVTDAGLQTLQKLPRLKQVYLWQTKVTPEAAQAFADSRIDKDQLQRWQEEIEQLKKKMREAQSFVMDIGAPVEPPATTNATPINSQCPVSGKPIDPAKTVIHETKLIAFCCDDCKAKFQQDPKPFLSKLESATPAKESTTESKK
jgi:mono/diheme cytochrome c family protein